MGFAPHQHTVVEANRQGLTGALSRTPGLLLEPEGPPVPRRACTPPHPPCCGPAPPPSSTAAAADGRNVGTWHCTHGTKMQEGARQAARHCWPATSWTQGYWNQCHCHFEKLSWPSSDLFSPARKGHRDRQAPSPQGRLHHNLPAAPLEPLPALPAAASGRLRHASSHSRWRAEERMTRPVAQRHSPPPRSHQATGMPRLPCRCPCPQLHPRRQTLPPPLLQLQQPGWPARRPETWVQRPLGPPRPAAAAAPRPAAASMPLPAARTPSCGRRANAWTVCVAGRERGDGRRAGQGSKG